MNVVILNLYVIESSKKGILLNLNVIYLCFIGVHSRASNSPFISIYNANIIQTKMIIEKLYFDYLSEVV